MNLAKHIILDLYDCDFDLINSVEFVKSVLTKAVEISECKILNKYFHKFSPQGVTGIICVCESHFSIHTWPEHNYVAIDIFCCKENTKKSIEYLCEKFKSKNKSIKTVNRGEIHEDNIG
jgi:S-adenosylmethionine decarboxylase